jgi:two-component system OmpR family response regulator
MRILLLEDHQSIDRSAERSLHYAGYAIDRMSTAAAALHALEAENFDLLLLDSDLCNGDGIGFLTELRRRGWRMPVLVLTANADLERRLQCLNSGADDYMIKPVAADELCARARALTRRQFGTLAATFTLGRVQIDMADRRALLQGRVLEFSRREWSVLEYLALSAGKVISKSQLIQAIASWDQAISSNAIEAYVHRVRNKLIGSQVSIRTIRGLGYVMSEDREERAVG